MHFLQHQQHQPLLPVPDKKIVQCCQQSEALKLYFLKNVTMIRTYKYPREIFCQCQKGEGNLNKRMHDNEGKNKILYKSITDLMSEPQISMQTIIKRNLGAPYHLLGPAPKTHHEKLADNLKSSYQKGWSEFNAKQNETMKA